MSCFFVAKNKADSQNLAKLSSASSYKPKRRAVMLKHHNIKLNSSGKVSCLLLLLLTFLLINPATTSVSALEPEEATNNTGAPVTQTDAKASRIEISFTPTEVSGEMAPTTEAGLKKQLEATATITIQNAEDYTIYIGVKTTGLVGVNSGETIESIKSATSYEDLAANSWGIYYGEGTSAPDNATYKPVETSRGTQIEAGGRTTTALTKTYVLSFAANINNQMPADTYENQITLSVVSSPLEIANDFSIATMQEMTSTVCENATDLDNDGEISAQLKDVRDGKYYWVGKLADGKCWMTQNLDLDLSTSKTLTSADTDVSSNWTPGFTTFTTADASTVNSDSQIETRSWSLGNYRLTDPTTSASCGYPLNDASQCPGSNATSGLTTNRFTAYTTPITQNGDISAHYILGNHYAWNAATAGTGGSITSDQATNSICPKGWRLPTSNTGGEFEALVNKLGGTSSTDNVTKAPFYGVRGGFVDQSTNLLFEDAGDQGRYWSSTPAPSDTANSAYALRFGGTSTVNPSGASADRSVGYPVRCIAR